jgi:hypothetical protein
LPGGHSGGKGSQNGTGVEKRAAEAGGSKSKQGGVKQSGQEPLDVQKMDASVMIVKA